MIHLSISLDELSKNDPHPDHWVIFNEAQFGPYSSAADAIQQAIALLQQHKDQLTQKQNDDL